MQIRFSQFLALLFLNLITFPAAAHDMAKAMQACVVCHGKEGKATPDGFYPRIAGKPSQYIYQQLKNFQQGKRAYAPMTHMVRNLSDGYLMEIAEYFANLNLPYPSPTSVASLQVSVSQLGRGELLAKKGDASQQIPACATCHGAAFTGMLPATPGLLGLPRDYINAQVGAWKEGTRVGQAPDCMRKLSKQLSNEDLSAVSAWLATQPVPANSKPVASTLPEINVRCKW